jgi:hypothetical protein
MRAGLGSALAAFLAASIAMFPSSALCQSPKDNSAVAKALLEEAREASGLGEWERAAACLDEAVVQAPGNSDILYLRALASVRRAKPFAEALGDLDAALGTGRFQLYSRREASVLKAELLVRERRWKSALDALGSPASENEIDPAYGLIRAKALVGMGEGPGFTDQIENCLRRFPNDVSFARLFMAHAGKIPSSEKARALGELILGRVSSYASADPEFPVVAAPLMRDLSSRRDAVLAYRAMGGASSKATLRALEYGILDEAAASAELLSGKYPVSLEDLSALLALAGSPDGRSAVQSAIASWTGEVLVDADSDGIYEARFDLDKGSVRGWSLDSRQSGFVDEKADFSEGLPKELKLSRDGLDIEVKYDTYPAASIIAFDRKGTVSRYAFGPGGFAFAPLEMRPFAGSGKDSIYFPYAQGATDPSERACAAVALSVENVEGNKRELVTLNRGLPVSAVTFVDERLFSERSYEKGHPVLERVDADGDGRFETERIFEPEKGARGEEGPWRVAWIRSDLDGDGVYEYREQTVFPFLKEWDYEGNGNVDARRENLSDGSVRESFSSRLDGRLDEEIVVKDDKIVSIARNGVRLALIPDSDPRLTWIGEKKFDLGSELPSGEGIFTHMGKRYRLIRIGALAFAELIP